VLSQLFWHIQFLLNQTLPVCTIYFLALMAFSVVPVCLPCLYLHTEAKLLLRELHWLLVEQRITYKLAVLTFKIGRASTLAFLS